MTDPDPLEGTPYKTLHALDQGGMGQVVLAEHRTLGQQVVAKLLLSVHAGDDRLVDRMRVEAQTLGGLNHPNLVRVTDFGRANDGRPYLVMEWLKGHTLWQEVRERGHVSVYEAVEWVSAALRGLSTAHAAGLVHRDLKPTNIFLAEAGDGQRVIKVIDFGIVKVLDRSSAKAPEFPTEEGVLVGTPRYASPEQFRQTSIDARSDLYSMGLVLYHLVAGRGPFDDAKRDVEVVRAHLLEQPAAPSKWAAEPIPRELDDLILRSLEKEPSNRFQSASEMANALTTVAALLKAPAGWAATTTWDPATLAQVQTPQVSVGAAQTEKIAAGPARWFEEPPPNNEGAPRTPLMACEDSEPPITRTRPPLPLGSDSTLPSADVAPPMSEGRKPGPWFFAAGLAFALLALTLLVAVLLRPN